MNYIRRVLGIYVPRFYSREGARLARGEIKGRSEYALWNFDLQMLVRHWGLMAVGLGFQAMRRAGQNKHAGRGSVQSGGRHLVSTSRIVR
jgi:hypothetical protein